MSAPEVTAPALTEPTAATATETSPAVEITTSAPADQLAPTPAADHPITEAEVAAPSAAESSPVDESKATETKPEEKKEKKQGRKPFADLLNKILKPHPQDKSVLEKKSETEPPAVDEEAAPEVVAPAVEAPAAEAELAAPSNEAVAITEGAATTDVPAQPTQADDLAKETTTPRKERGNIFEKLTAFVLKPKSPKSKKLDTKEDGEEAKIEAPVIEDNADAQPVEHAAPNSPKIAAPDTTETPAAEAVATTIETTEEVKVDKKEKTPKDLAKLARRFSGRLFGVEKKKDSAKKPQPTEEEAEAHAATPAEASDAAPQIPVETTPELTQPSTDSAPVIAAAA